MNNQGAQVGGITEAAIDKIPGMSRAGKVRAKQTLREGEKAVKAFSDHIEGKPPADDGSKDVGGVSGQRLKAFIERVERMDEEIKALGEDKKEIFAEAKAVGFDTKIMRKVIRLRKMDPEKRKEEEALLDLYASAIGLQLSLDV